MHVRFEITQFNQRTDDPVVHLSLLILSTQEKVTMRQTVQHRIHLRLKDFSFISKLEKNLSRYAKDNVKYELYKPAILVM